MSKFLGFFVMCILICRSSVALSADQSPDALSFLQSWPQLGKVLAFVLALQIFLRGLAEGLTRISDFTDNTWDNKLAAVLSELAWFLGTILGKVGYGEPSLVTKEKVAQLAVEKDVTSNGP